MALKTAEDFVKDLQNDETLLSTVKEQVGADPKNRHDVVAGLGYEFTDDEFKAALESAGAEHTDLELSESELETVAGGAPHYTDFGGKFKLSTKFGTAAFNFQQKRGKRDGMAKRDIPVSAASMEHATYW
jgi:predicted ribosomally synthesized peptide with nif11-like leader